MTTTSTSPRDLTEKEERILREVDKQLPRSSWGAVVTVAHEGLRRIGFISGGIGMRARITPAGRKWLNDHPLSPKADPAAKPDASVTKASGDGAGAVRRQADRLLEEIEGLFDEQTYDERKKESHTDEPDEAEYSVNVTIGLMRRISKFLNARNTPATPSPDGDAETDAAFVGELARLVQTLIDNEPDEPIADGGHVVFDLWRHDAKKLLARRGARTPEAAPSPAAGGWQPIETAPRDKSILVWGPRIAGGIPAMAHWGKVSHIPIYGFVLLHGDPEDRDSLPASHWMPLPLPPSSSPAEPAPPVTSDPVAVVRSYRDGWLYLSTKNKGSTAKYFAGKAQTADAIIEALEKDAALRSSSKGGA